VHVVCRDTEHLRVLTIEFFTGRPEMSRIETSLVFSFTSSGLPVDAAAPVREQPSRRRGEKKVPLKR
jgi:hypothetical protein